MTERRAQIIVARAILRRQTRLSEDTHAAYLRTFGLPALVRLDDGDGRAAYAPTRDFLPSAVVAVLEHETAA